MISPRSNAATVRNETVAALARSVCNHPNQPRAARDCSGVIVQGCRANSDACRILLDLSNVACGSFMRWDRLTLTALGGIAVFLIGAALLLEDAQPPFAPVIGMVGGIAALALADRERLRLRMEALEKRLAQREWRDR